MSEAKHTPGPWGWYGDTSRLYLATRHRGRQYVMDFARLGMNKAQPRFQINGLMEPAIDLVRFEVGNGTAKGRAEGKADPSVYRYDITDIDHPDARLMVASPDLFEALETMISTAEALGPAFDPHSLQQARAALAKAKGEAAP